MADHPVISSPSEADNPQNNQPINPNKRSWKRWLVPEIFVLLVLIIIGAAITWVVLWRQNKKADERAQTTANDIITTFTPTTTPDSTTVLSNSPSASSGQGSNSFNTSTFPRLPLPPPPPMPPVAVSRTYRNENLRFQMKTSTRWQDQIAPDGSAVFVNAEHQQINVQSYINLEEDLETIEQGLKLSQSVKKITKSTFKNLPSVTFETTDGQQAVAVIANNRIYYIFGVNFLNPSDFSFF